MQHQTMTVATPNHCHHATIPTEHHRDPHRSSRDLLPLTPSLGGLDPAEVPGDPPTALANGTPPAEREVDVLFGYTALRMTPASMRAEVQHLYLRLGLHLQGSCHESSGGLPTGGAR